MMSCPACAKIQAKGGSSCWQCRAGATPAAPNLPPSAPQAAPPLSATPLHSVQARIEQSRLAALERRQRAQQQQHVQQQQQQQQQHVQQQVQQHQVLAPQPHLAPPQQPKALHPPAASDPQHQLQWHQHPHQQLWQQPYQGSHAAPPSQPPFPPQPLQPALATHPPPWPASTTHPQPPSQPLQLPLDAQKPDARRETLEGTRMHPPATALAAHRPLAVLPPPGLPPPSPAAQHWPQQTSTQQPGPQATYVQQPQSLPPPPPLPPTQLPRTPAQQQTKPLAPQPSPQQPAQSPNRSSAHPSAQAPAAPALAAPALAAPAPQPPRPPPLQPPQQPPLPPTQRQVLATLQQQRHVRLNGAHDGTPVVPTAPCPLPSHLVTATAPPPLPPARACAASPFALPCCGSSVQAASTAATSATSDAPAAPAPPAARRSLAVELAVEEVAGRPEKPKTALACVTFPPELLPLARRALAGLPGASLVPGLGPQRLKVPLESYKALLELLEKDKGGAVGLTPAHPIERAALAYAPPLSEATAAKVMSEHLPERLSRSLFEFQREGVQFALRHGGRALIADEMGLGKTVQAICTALCYPNDWPALVICPASLVDNWANELSNWLGRAGVLDPSRLVHRVKKGADPLRPPRAAHALAAFTPRGAGGSYGSTSSSDDDGSNQGGSQDGSQGGRPGGSPGGSQGGAGGVARGVTIISYALAEKAAADLLRCGFGILICDESHALKGADTKRTKALIPMIAQARRALLLSGTLPRLSTAARSSSFTPSSFTPSSHPSPPLSCRYAGALAPDRALHVRACIAPCRLRHPKGVCGALLRGQAREMGLGR